MYRLAYGNLNSLLKAKTHYLENENYLDDIFDLTSTNAIRNFNIMKSELSDYIDGISGSRGEDGMNIAQASIWNMRT